MGRHAGRRHPGLRHPGRLAGIVAALLVLAGGVAAVVAVTQGASSTQTLRAAFFSTRLPAGWTATATRLPSGATTYALGSTRGRLNQLNIPPEGEIGITVGEFSVAGLAAAGDPQAANQSPLELLPNVVGIPRSAKAPETTAAAHATTLAGASAAAIAYRYTYAGVPNVQSDIVAQRGDAIVSIEVDAEPSLQPRAASALAGIIKAWRWETNPAAAPPGAPAAPGAGASASSPPANV